ncbi:uncharacterized protein LOC123526740 [Mercenaria mercenaria]|uniref:uncharacterized protein LOC123526740 n=1 Tax=Mercenaria mercenaria TaxID=6596 RepID=UPI00234F179E|nr:uncharacterized protein LOC123526740 [Mercenaria mercenaria]
MISHVLIYLCLASGIKGAFCVNVTLLPSSADVVENGKINLTCYNDEQKGDVAVWTNSNGLAESVTIYNNSKCTVAGFLANTSLYTTYCMGGGSFVLQLNNVDRRMHDVSWICAYRFEDGIQVKSNNASVYVIVPVKYIRIIELNEDKSNTVSVIEKHQTTLKYNVSFSRPSPNVSCFLCMNDNSITLHVGNFIPNRWKYEMVFTFNRTFNGWMIHCSASNMQTVTVTSKRLNLNVLCKFCNPRFVVSSI